MEGACDSVPSTQKLPILGYKRLASVSYLSTETVYSTAAVVGSERLEIEIQEESNKVMDDDHNTMIVSVDKRISYQDIQRAASRIYRGEAFVGLLGRSQPRMGLQPAWGHCPSDRIYGADRADGRWLTRAASV
jgi:hypothetical protein